MKKRGPKITTTGNPKDRERQERHRDRKKRGIEEVIESLLPQDVPQGKEAVAAIRAAHCKKYRFPKDSPLRGLGQFIDWRRFLADWPRDGDSQKERDCVMRHYEEAIKRRRESGGTKRQNGLDAVAVNKIYSEADRLLFTLLHP
jgi:hypothetical protein